MTAILAILAVWFALSILAGLFLGACFRVGSDSDRPIAGFGTDDWR